MTAPPRVTVAICTLDRPLGLSMLLGAIDRQEIGTWPDDAVTVLVVDNSASGSVRALCAARAEAGRFRLVHVHEARRGLSFARNAALAEALGTGASHIAFVDDDEVPDPRWLSALHARLVETGAAAAVGPVRPVFESHPPQWAVAGGFFAKTLDRGGDLSDAYTCNVMVEMATVTRHGLAFEPRFNSTGGEDTIFFESLRAAGGRIAWAADAMVHEFTAGQPDHADVADEAMVSDRRNGGGARSPWQRLHGRTRLQRATWLHPRRGRMRSHRPVSPDDPISWRVPPFGALHRLPWRRAHRGLFQVVRIPSMGHRHTVRGRSIPRKSWHDA